MKSLSDLYTNLTTLREDINTIMNLKATKKQYERVRDYIATRNLGKEIFDELDKFKFIEDWQNETKTCKGVSGIMKDVVK